MRSHSILTIAAALALSLPLGAAHRPRGDNYRGFDSRRGPAISVQVAVPFGVGIVNRGYDRDRRFDRYDGRYYRDSRSFNQRQKFLKKLHKQRLKEERRFRNQRHHFRGSRW